MPVARNTWSAGTVCRRPPASNVTPSSPISVTRAQVQTLMFFSLIQSV